MMRTHKYIKRTGATGNYRYWYYDPATRSLREGNPDEQEAGKKDHAERLIAHHAKSGELTDEKRDHIARETGIARDKVNWAISNARQRAKNRHGIEANVHEGKDRAHFGHDYHEHLVKEATLHPGSDEHEELVNKIHSLVSAGEIDPKSGAGRSVGAPSTSAPSRRPRAPAAPRAPRETIADRERAARRAESAAASAHIRGETPARPERTAAEARAIHTAGAADAPENTGMPPARARAATDGKAARIKANRERLAREHGINLGEDEAHAAASAERVRAARKPAPAAAPVGSRVPVEGEARVTSRRSRSRSGAPASALAADVSSAAETTPRADRDARARAIAGASAAPENTGLAPEIARASMPSSPAARAVAEVTPGFAADEAPIREMVQAQARGDNPYLNRAKEIFNRIKHDVKPERKQVAEHLFQAIESLKSSGTLSEANLVQKYKEISGRSVRGISGISDEFEKSTFMTLPEILENKPINVEVERMKRGYAMKQYLRLKPYLKDSWHAANPSAPPPMPTYGDIKSWSDHTAAGGTKPDWAGSTRMALPKEVHDAAPKGEDGKPKHPPAWMPIHLAPAWNYIVKKSGSEGNPYQTVNPVRQGRVEAGNVAGYQEGIAINALRKYVQMRGGPDQLVDIPSHKLGEVGLTHADIFKSKTPRSVVLDSDLKKIITTKIIDPVGLVHVLQSDTKPVKKSWSLVVKATAPVQWEDHRAKVTKDKFGGSQDALRKSELIEQIRKLKDGGKRRA